MNDGNEKREGDERSQADAAAAVVVDEDRSAHIADRSLVVYSHSPVGINQLQPLLSTIMCDAVLDEDVEAGCVFELCVVRGYVV